MVFSTLPYMAIMICCWSVPAAAQGKTTVLELLRILESKYPEESLSFTTTDIPPPFFLFSISITFSDWTALEYNKFTGHLEFDPLADIITFKLTELQPFPDAVEFYILVIFYSDVKVTSAVLRYNAMITRNNFAMLGTWADSVWIRCMDYSVLEGGNVPSLITMNMKEEGVIMLDGTTRADFAGCDNLDSWKSQTLK